jgi:hypothetical protein
MELPKEAVSELKVIHEGLTGEILTDSEAQEMGQDLFRLFLAIYEPLPKKWLDGTDGARGILK